MATEEIKQIKLGMKTGEVIDSQSHLEPADWYELLDRCKEMGDPFEAVALDLWETKEIAYVDWIEIDGVRKDAPFEYPGIPRWWENDYERPTMEFDPYAQSGNDPMKQGF